MFVVVYNDIPFTFLCTERLIYISALSNLRERAEISAVRCTNLSSKVHYLFDTLNLTTTKTLLKIMSWNYETVCT